ncbi:Heavy metal-associated isoprenylated plant protein 14 [Cardamine amara subsp. amara]|uniref:Heavy metal-associated isoprenylated plant protein 14 n=1 Tax=Cardamine amara subsp. amara TaxID=228776 RepID=A0ABD1AKS2_CARAN
MAAKKSVLQLSVHEDKIRKKALVTVSGYPGLTSIAIDDKTGKMTVVGEVDLPDIVMKLRKICNAEIVSVEVVKPPEEKKPDPAKPGEAVVFSVPMNYPCQYYPPPYAYSYY